MVNPGKVKKQTWIETKRTPNKSVLTKPKLSVFREEAEAEFNTEVADIRASGLRAIDDNKGTSRVNSTDGMTRLPQIQTTKNAVRNNLTKK
jgi:hypothetical protein